MALRRAFLLSSSLMRPSSVSPLLSTRPLSQQSSLLSPSSLSLSSHSSPLSKNFVRFSSSSIEEEKQQEGQEEVKKEQQEEVQKEEEQQQEEEEQEEQPDIGKRMLKASLLLGATSVVLYKVLSDKRKEVQEKREKEKSFTRSLGLPDIGGPFTMVDDTGKIVTDTDFKGKYTLMYFGFTFCPEICPAEMIKMGHVYDALTGQNSEISKEAQGELLPLFVSVDPWRDSVFQVHKYVQNYHKAFRGLTGTPEQVSRICKAFRVYSSKPEQVEVDSGMDYLVDHSIFIYLMDPNGRLLGYYGQDKTAEDVIEGVTEDIKAYEYRRSM